MPRTYEVTVQWDKELFSHAACDMKEAIEWARMYPRKARVRVWSGDGFMSVVRG